MTAELKPGAWIPLWLPEGKTLLVDEGILLERDGERAWEECMRAYSKQIDHMNKERRERHGADDSGSDG